MAMQVFQWGDEDSKHGPVQRFSSFTLNSVLYRVGDVVSLFPENEHEEHFLGRLVAAYLDERRADPHCIQINWFERIPGSRELIELQGETDINPVGCISGKVSVFRAANAEEAEKLGQHSRLPWYFCRDDSAAAADKGSVGRSKRPSYQPDSENSDSDGSSHGGGAGSSKSGVGATKRQRGAFEAANRVVEETIVRRANGAGKTSGVLLGGRVCVQCGATQTPQWREGPAGPKTLCNACGVRYCRLQQRTNKRTHSSSGHRAGGAAGASKLAARNKQAQQKRDAAKVEMAAYVTSAPAVQPVMVMSGDRSPASPASAVYSPRPGLPIMPTQPFLNGARLPAALPGAANYPATAFPFAPLSTTSRPTSPSGSSHLSNELTGLPTVARAGSDEAAPAAAASSHGVSLVGGGSGGYLAFGRGATSAERAASPPVIAVGAGAQQQLGSTMVYGGLQQLPSSGQQVPSPRLPSAAMLELHDAAGEAAVAAAAQLRHSINGGGGGVMPQPVMEDLAGQVAVGLDGLEEDAVANAGLQPLSARAVSFCPEFDIDVYESVFSRFDTLKEQLPADVVDRLISASDLVDRSTAQAAASEAAADAASKALLVRQGAVEHARSTAVAALSHMQAEMGNLSSTYSLGPVSSTQQQQQQQQQQSDRAVNGSAAGIAVGTLGGAELTASFCEGGAGGCFDLGPYGDVFSGYSGYSQVERHCVDLLDASGMQAQEGTEYVSVNA